MGRGGSGQHRGIGTREQLLETGAPPDTVEFRGITGPVLIRVTNTGDFGGWELTEYPKMVPPEASGANDNNAFAVSCHVDNVSPERLMCPPERADEH